MKAKHLLEELHNVCANGPLFAGDTISHETANELVATGWARRNPKGEFVATDEGRAVIARAKRT